MRILLTGSNGFLGQKITNFVVSQNLHELCCTSSSSNRNPNQTGYQFEQIDFYNLEQLGVLIANFKPTHIIHTAAISSVEQCEQNPELCRLVNIDTVRYLSEQSEKNNIHLTFLSTDFVFDGQSGPYKENDITSPTNAYGMSKLEAELILTSSNCRYAILRTILVYGIHADRKRSNLILWAKERLEKQESIQVVSDQWRMPTWVDDLANACILAAEHQSQGIFHISGNEMMRIIDVVVQVADFWKLDKNLIIPVAAREIGQDKNRPKKTGFILTKANQEIGYTPTPFLDSLKLIDQQFKIYR